MPGGPIDFVVTDYEPDRAFCIAYSNRRLSFSLAFVLAPDGDQTRLVSRARASSPHPVGEQLVRYLLAPGDGIMVRKQLLGIKERAEALAAG